jgi:hypothetical protein
LLVGPIPKQLPYFLKPQLLTSKLILLAAWAYAQLTCIGDACCELRSMLFSLEGRQVSCHHMLCVQVTPALLIKDPDLQDRARV